MIAWYYAKNNQQYGPVAFEALQQLAGDGLLSPVDLVWHASLADWQPAGEVSGLFQAVPQQATAPAAPFAVRAAPASAAIAGTATPIGYQTARQNVGPSQQGLAITALVLGCASFMFFGPLLGIPALVWGKIALRNMRTYGNYEGKGMAQAGVVIGYIWCGLIVLIGCIVALIVLVMAFAAAASR